MRTVSYVLGLAALGTLLLAAAPTSSAVAYCVHDVKEPIPYDDCDGLVCLGYNSQSGWQTCASPDPCLYRTDCCGTSPQGSFCP